MRWRLVSRSGHPDPELFYRRGARKQVMSKKKLLIALVTLAIVAYVLKEKR
ncbi:hypothetical protein HLRTI_000856 [Halorhabdus tiamatea SARL4B]|uniref:Uncharacterized protein n=1 Tax=Halorhabdus tiamatea SARL4B TaxID=1033806 RepID=U2E455_9EURY|nr:hypothetical protein HLRTI_000856 [Halorhabdus tiamatea SARL4B]